VQNLGFSLNITIPYLIEIENFKKIIFNTHILCHNHCMISSKTPSYNVRLEGSSSSSRNLDLNSQLFGGTHTRINVLLELEP
jgi:hypothetical protein